MVRLSLLCLAFSWTAFAAPLGANERSIEQRDVLPPSQDPFYQPTEDLECEEPGTILNKRQIAVPPALESLLPGITESVWQILYRSTDSQDEANAVVTTLFVPKNNKDKHKHFLHAVAYDASDVDCSPSYASQTMTASNPDLAVIAIGLANGWYVSTPDYESYTAGFTNGVLSGQTTLDSIRASLHSHSFTGISRHAKTVVNGGSGGGIAAEWAAELQHDYAPEVKIAGITLGSLVPDVGSVYQTVNGQIPAGLIPPSMLGLAQSIPSFGEYLNKSLNATLASKFLDASKKCLVDNTVAFALQNVSQYFNDPDFATSSVAKDTLNKYALMGKHGVPKIPLYLYKGGLDEVSPAKDTDALVAQYCSQGAPSITYVKNPLVGHISNSFLGFAGALKYLEDRLNDVPVTTGCTYANSTKTSFDDSDAAALGNNSQALLPALQAALPPSITL